MIIEPQTDIYEFGDFRLDAARRLLMNDLGDSVPLMPKAFDTLLYLVRHSGKVIEKDELLSEIWADSVVEENNLTQNISILRRLLGEKPGEHRFIVTVPGRGYKFVAAVKRAETSGPPDLSSAQPDTIPAGDLATAAANAGSRAKGGLPAVWSRPWLLAAVVFLVLALGAAGFYFWRGKNGSGGVPVRSIAVLPFKPLVPQDGNEALELGMADALINKISASDEVIVRPLGSVRRFNRLDQDVLQVGSELGVDSILDGTIQTSGDRIRIAARLVSTSDGKQLWTQTFDEKFTDIFTIQDLISTKVLAALTLTLSGDQQKRLTRHETANIEAYQLYMQGRFHSSHLVLPEAQKGLAYFQQAIALDPNYALAYVGIAEANIKFALSGDVPPYDTMPKAKAAALKAVELDPGVPEVQAILGQIAFWFDHDWNEAEMRYDRALELDPNNAAANFYYAHLSSNLGKHADALRLGRRARELDPLSLIVNSAEGQFLFFAGKPDEAVARLNKTLELDPNFWHAHLVLSAIYAEGSNFAEAVTEAEKAALTSGGNSQAIALKAYALARSGKMAEARSILSEMQKLSATRYIPAYNFAIVHNALGDTEKALDQLEIAFKENNVLMVFLKVDPKWNNLRSEPRFIALSRQMNFE